MSVSAAQIGLSLFSKIADATLSGGGKEKSLVAATKGARFEPIVLVDSDVTSYEGIADVMQSLQSMFTGYLLQAVALHGQVGGTKAIKELDRFNPNRDTSDDSPWKFISSLESYKDRMVTPKGSITLESFDTNPTRYSRAYKVALENSAMNISRPSDYEKQIHQSVNLSIGKIWNVEFTSNGQKTNVPVTVRLLSAVIPTDRLTHILTHDANQLTDLKERYYAWRAGRLNFISDLLFCKDLLREKRKALMNDNDGVYSQIINRRLNNNLATLNTGKASLASASNMAVISSDTAKRIEQRLGGKLSTSTTREMLYGTTNARDKLTQASGLMILAIIDKFADRVTFYTEGISESTNLSLREIKSSNRSDGPDVSEILKAYQLGHAPSNL